MCDPDLLCHLTSQFAKLNFMLTCSSHRVLVLGKTVSPLRLCGVDALGILSSQSSSPFSSSSNSGCALSQTCLK